MFLSCALSPAVFVVTYDHPAPPCSPDILLTSPNDLDFSGVMFRFISDLQPELDLELNGVALLYEDTDFGVNSAAAQNEFAEEFNIEVLEEVCYCSQSSALTAEIQQLRASEADVLLPSSYVSDAILTLQTAQELGYAPTLIIAQNAGYLDNVFLEAVGDDAESIFSRAAYSADVTTINDAAGPHQRCGWPASTSCMRKATVAY